MAASRLRIAAGSQVSRIDRLTWLMKGGQAAPLNTLPMNGQGKAPPPQTPPPQGKGKAPPLNPPMGKEGRYPSSSFSKPHPPLPGQNPDCEH